MTCCIMSCERSRILLPFKTIQNSPDTNEGTLVCSVPARKSVIYGFRASLSFPTRPSKSVPEHRSSLKRSDKASFLIIVHICKQKTVNFPS